MARKKRTLTIAPEEYYKETRGKGAEWEKETGKAAQPGGLYYIWMRGFYIPVMGKLLKMLDERWPSPPPHSLEADLRTKLVRRVTGAIKDIYRRLKAAALAREAEAIRIKPEALESELARAFAPKAVEVAAKAAAPAGATVSPEEIVREALAAAGA